MVDRAKNHRTVYVRTVYVADRLAVACNRSEVASMPSSVPGGKVSTINRARPERKG